MNRTVSFSWNETKHSVVSKNRLIYYCPITKVGSTFWKRILTVLDSQGKYSSPFELDLGQVKLLNAKELSATDLKRVEENGTSFMFVRDPYARIFSGYENKIYHSNLMYWNAIGKHVIRLIRKSNDDVYTKYGFDVTFPEFIKYLLYLSENNKNVDIHFKPMVSICDPCSTHFQYIGKMETFKKDADFLISKWRQKEFGNVTIEFGNFEKDSIVDTARGRIKFLFQTKTILDQIRFPFEKLMLRTWRDLQIRGYISKHVKFPYEHYNVTTITKEDFIAEVKKALEAIPDRETIKKQREEALVQSYRQVSIEDMERLREFVREDCQLFGYDDKPAHLFDRTTPLQDDFLYLDGLDT
ncbi:carbohydrate sulfotransferase 11-like isoform X2 [Ruditapes philippinarum]|nr:carbohydrate sulfotransferase 11-like isoform X2 [Ruditapes philippinarum]